MSLPTTHRAQLAIARRTDVALRAKFPHLETRIFEIAPHAYIIVFHRDQLDASAVQADFNNSVSPATAQITLSNTIPTTFIQEIAPIEDAVLARNLEGFSFSLSDIRDILLAKYPDLPAFSRAPSRNNPITLVFERSLSASQEERVRDFMEGVLPGWPVAITTGSPERLPERVQTVLDQSLAIRPSSTRPQIPSFVREDEEFWFSNTDALFENRLHPNAFVATADAGATCYIDASSFPQLDLRQAVLLYDTIYLTPPIIEPQPPGPSFWDSQTVKRDEVLHLLEVGRLRIVLAQPEERTELALLRAAHERNPAAIIGRRTAAAILISDIVQTAEEYKLASPDLRPVVGELADRIATETNSSFETILRLLLWPIHARRACLRSMLANGLMGIGTFSQGAILADQLKTAAGKDFTLEADFTSNSVHVAHALNATFIPPLKEMEGWLRPRGLVGDRLNFYRSFNSRIARCLGWQ